jgi:LmbE family N-acetylglucosaminyl deacetylase
VAGRATARRKGPARVTIFSPHLDDAVLSAWHVLSSANEIKVITVFAGVPEPGFVPELDRHHGATESAAWVRRRRVDDTAALTAAGAEPVHLDLLEAQFSAFAAAGLRHRIAARPADFVELVADAPGVGTEPGVILDSIRPYAGPETTVYGPAGIGRHPDHRSLSQAVLRLASDVRELHLFADSPYFIRQGLPSWISGRDNPAADRLVDRALSDLGVPSDALPRQVVALAPAELGAKFHGLRRYTTEFSTLEKHFGRAPARPEMAGFEVFWKVPRA